MHTTNIEPLIRDRYRALKGREFAFTDIDPFRVAHLIIDMQNGFVAEGAMFEVPEARTVVDNINLLSDTIRTRGGQNYYFAFTTDTADDWPVYFRQFLKPDFAQAEVDAFRPGSAGHQLYSQLDVHDVDTVVRKTRFSPFTPGSSNALELLTARGIDTVVISGTLTDCCCSTAARDAQQLGFRVLFVSDATAALSDDEHNAAISSLAAWFADIRTTEQTVELLNRTTTVSSVSGANRPDVPSRDPRLPTNQDT